MKEKDTQNIYVPYQREWNIKGNLFLRPYIIECVVEVKFRCGKNGEWIVHRDIVGKRKWTITHAPSSMRVYQVDKLADAKALVRALSVIDSPLRMPPSPPANCVVPRYDDMPMDVTLYRLEEEMHRQYTEWVNSYKENAEFLRECREVIQAWRNTNTDEKSTR